MFLSLTGTSYKGPNQLSLPSWTREYVRSLLGNGSPNRISFIERFFLNLCIRFFHPLLSSGMISFKMAIIGYCFLESDIKCKYSSSDRRLSKSRTLLSHEVLFRAFQLLSGIMEGRRAAITLFVFSISISIRRMSQT